MEEWKNPAAPPRDGVTVAIYAEGSVSLGWWDAVGQCWHRGARANDTVEVQAWTKMPAAPMAADMPWIAPASDPDAGDEARETLARCGMSAKQIRDGGPDSNGNYFPVGADREQDESDDRDQT